MYHGEHRCWDHGEAEKVVDSVGLAGFNCGNHATPHRPRKAALASGARGCPSEMSDGAQVSDSSRRS